MWLVLPIVHSGSNTVPAPVPWSTLMEAVNYHLRSLITLWPPCWRGLMACGHYRWQSQLDLDFQSPLQGTRHTSQAIWNPLDQSIWIPLSGWHHSQHHMEPMNHPPEPCTNFDPQKLGEILIKVYYFKPLLFQGVCYLAIDGWNMRILFANLTDAECQHQI